MTRLGRYLEATGTQQSWLAERVGITSSTVNRWVKGSTPMSAADKAQVLRVLRERAAVSLDGLLDDQREKQGAQLPAVTVKPDAAAEASGATVPSRSRPARQLGAHDGGRRREPVRQVARCHGCGEEREGTTTFESMTYGNKPVGYPIHFCDDCEAALAVNERPLEEVLLDMGAASSLGTLID